MRVHVSGLEGGPFFGDFGERLLKKVVGFAKRVEDLFLDFEQPGEGNGAEAEQAQDGEGVAGFIVGGFFDDPAHVDADQVGFVDKPVEAVFFQVTQVGFAELAAVEAVLEVVAVAGRGTARTGGGGLSRHGDF